MSTCYAPLKKPILASHLFDGRLGQFGVSEAHVPNPTTDGFRYLTDGRNAICVSVDEDGNVSQFTRYGMNAVGKILGAISEAFDVEIASEHEPQYWGFDTQEEWDAAWQKMADEDQEQFYGELVKYVHGEPNNLIPGTIGMLKAEIAKALVEKDASLLTPESKIRFHDEIEAMYDRKHAVTIKLVREISRSLT